MGSTSRPHAHRLDLPMLGATGLPRPSRPTLAQRRRGALNSRCCANEERSHPSPATREVNASASLETAYPVPHGPSARKRTPASDFPQSEQEAANTDQRKGYRTRVRSNLSLAWARAPSFEAGQRQSMPVASPRRLDRPGAQCGQRISRKTSTVKARV